ncbi:MAG TPA: peptidyl-prolyl cis-trans isomerase [Candidatus Polarisedimenticolia bacterium]|jgi:peptidyl-prolyl cis-trans isomerase D|nr:peptidyl-prolyl cis-trans isomerase [Candidatus Polarisedimenticolia bacterium]
MLNVFRENLRHLKWILVAVVLSFILTIFAVWGGGIGGGRSAADRDRESWAARIGDQIIGVQAFQQEARNMEYTYRQILGSQFEQQRPFLRLGQAAVNRLVDREILTREAADAGLKVSEQEVAEAIMKNPSFQQNGVFIGRERYEQLFRGNEARFEDFERQIRQDLLLDKLRSVVEDSAMVSEAELREAYTRQNEKASVQYFVLSSARLPAGPPTEAAIEQYYRQHAADYPSGEGRSGRFVLFDLNDLASKIDVPEAEIRSQYAQGQKTQYTLPERRRASHILIKLKSDATPDQVKSAEDKARKALARVRSGEDFAKVAREVSEDSSASAGGDLNYFAREQMVREFSDAAWSLKVGQISDVVRSPFGFHVIRLTDMQPGHEMSLAEARPQILASLRRERAAPEAQRGAQEFAARLRAAGGDFAKAAAAAGLPVRDFRDFHRGDEFPSLGRQPALEAQLFSLKPGAAGEAVPLSMGVAVVQFLSATPGAPLPLAKVKERVRTDLVKQGRVGGAARMIAAAGGASDLASTAKRLKVELKSEPALARGGALPGLEGDPEAMSRIFALKPGETLGPVAVSDGVAMVRIVARPDPLDGFEAQKETVRSNLLAAKKDRLFRAYLQRLRSAHRVEINTALVEQVDRA